MSGTRIGFIGLGMMGGPMARNLVKAGRQLLACDPNAAVRDALAEGAPAGAVAFAATPAEVAAGAEIIILMLPDSPVVARVMEGEGGLLAALKPGHLVVDMSSSIPGETRRQAAAAAAKGAGYIDAPVSGGVVKAVAGTLAIMIGADDESFARAQPVLAQMGAELIRTGAIGSAHAMKALNNYVYAAGLLAASEAACMGAKLGLDLNILADVLNASSGRNFTTETRLKGDILSGRYKGGFQLGLMRKDLDTAGAIAAETGFDAQELAVCRAQWAAAVEAFGFKADNTEIHRYLANKGK